EERWLAAVAPGGQQAILDQRRRVVGSQWVERRPGSHAVVEIPRGAQIDVQFRAAEQYDLVGLAAARVAEVQQPAQLLELLRLQLVRLVDDDQRQHPAGRRIGQEIAQL